MSEAQVSLRIASLIDEMAPFDLFLSVGIDEDHDRELEEPVEELLAEFELDL